MNPTKPQALPDVGQAIRVHRLLFVAIVAIAIASSLGYSFSQEKTYTAEASLSFRDDSLDLSRLGLPVVPTQTASERAAQNAQTITRLDVIRQVKDAINSPLSVAELSNEVSAAVEPTSTLVNLTATAGTARGARKLANAFAIEGADVVNEETRAAYAAQGDELRQRSLSTDDPIARAGLDDDVSRLRALSQIAAPASVAALAATPSSPTSPRPVRNGILGGVLGIVLGLLAVFLRDSFDRRLRRSSEIEAEAEIPILGHVGEKLLGLATRSGGHKGITEPDWELFRILRRRLDFVGPSPARLVAVTSSMPEEGKTTVASFLAFANAALGARTLLIECDLRRSVLADRLGLASAPGLTDFVAGDAKPSEIVQTVAFGHLPGSNGTEPVAATMEKQDGTAVSHSHQLACITAGTRVQDPVEVLRSEQFRSMLRVVQDAYDLVVLDTPPLLVVVDVLELLPEVDTILMCVRASRTTRDQVRAGKEALARLPDRPTGLVVTGAVAGGEPGYEHYGYY